MIQDSGNRRTFDTGAVRDIQEGKGRPTLMPLEVVSRLILEVTGSDGIIDRIHQFTKFGDTYYLYLALMKFMGMAYDHNLQTMLLEVSKHYEEGCAKYGEDNWRHGIPVNCYLDSAIRHYLKYRRMDKDENHDRAFVWNILCCIWEVDHHHD